MNSARPGRLLERAVSERRTGERLPVRIRPDERILSLLRVSLGEEAAAAVDRPHRSLDDVGDEGVVARRTAVTVLLDHSALAQQPEELVDRHLRSLARAVDGEEAQAGHVEAEQVMVSSSDNGIGIAADDLPYVFEKFYRVADVEKTHEGTGLGLNIVKTIVEDHDGRIWVDSYPGEGTTFTIVLPLYNNSQSAS